MVLRDAVKPFDTRRADTKTDLSREFDAFKFEFRAKIAETKAEILMWLAVGLIAVWVVLNAIVVVGSTLFLLKLLGH